MWRRTVLISIIFLVLVIMAGAVFLYWQSSKLIEAPAPSAGLTNETDINNQNTEGDNQTGEPSNPAPIPTKPVSSLESQTRLFVERYSTYSTDYPYENLKSVVNMVTDSYKSDIQAVIEQGLSKISETVPFYSVSTKVLTIDKIKDDGQSATVEVLTQRAESYSRTDAPIISYKKISLDLEYTNGNWLISSAKWLTE